MEIERAVYVLTEAFKKDPEFRQSYQSNIAMAFKDEYSRRKKDKNYLNSGDIHEIANEAADAFINVLCICNDLPPKHIDLKEFIKNHIEPNSLIRLVYKSESGHKTVLKDWNQVSMEWEIINGKGENRHYINNKVIGVTDISTRKNCEAINIVIEELAIQPHIDEVVKGTPVKHESE